MQPLTYQQALDYLFSFPDTERTLPNRPVEFNLPRTAALLTALGSPQHAFSSVVIAGTKGKGSTAALLEAIARAAGLRTGLWTSPHLHSYRERIQVDRALIPRDAFAAQVAAIQPVVAAFDQDYYGQPTVFELGFVIALHYFAAQHIDLAIVEVGLGGRYDSASSITPLLSVISSISYDHMRILGDTLQQIAQDKAGILKPGVPAITIAQQPEAMGAIARVAAEVGTPLWIASEISDWGLAIERPDQPLVSDLQAPTVFNPFDRYTGPCTTALRGVFQRENARLAAGAALLLRDQGLPIDDNAIGVGLATAQWPGRLEIVPGAPAIVLDGAHNGDSAHKLIQSLAEAFPGRRLVLVLGTSRDKDIPRILAELAPAAGALVLTRSQHARALIDLEDLAARARPLVRDPQAPIEIVPGVPEALERARTLAGPEDLICVTGSLYVVAAAREALGLAGERD